jgi:hypothetical protein
MNTVLPEDDSESVPRNARSKLSDVPPPVKTVSRVKIVLEEDPGIPPTGLYISANGRPYLLMPGVEAEVPQEVVSVLNDAVTRCRSSIRKPSASTGYRPRLGSL